MNKTIIADEFEQAMGEVPDWWTDRPTDEELIEMARRWEEEQWGRLVTESDALDHWEGAA